MSSKYDQYIHNPPHLRLSLKSDKSVVFDGLMIGHQQLGYGFTLGHQFVRKPFKGDNPCHTHNFQEFLAWYRGNPDDPNDFGAEVVFFFGAEMEKFVHTENLKLYRKLLAETTDEQKRRTLLKLLAEEEAKKQLPRK